MSEIAIREYLLPNGRSPYERWFTRLDARAAAKVSVALTRLELGNDSNTKSLGGGTKNRQRKDIETAKALWQDYKQRKKKE